MKKPFLYILLAGLAAVIFLLVPRKYKHDSFDELTIETPIDIADQSNTTPEEEGMITNPKPDTLANMSDLVLQNDSNSPSTQDTILLGKLKGRLIKHTELPNNQNLNSRLWMGKFFNTFKEGDYISGEELGLHYKNNKHTKAILRSTFYNFFKNNIDSIVRRENKLIIRTVKEEGFNTSLKIPLLVSFSCQVNDSAQITFEETIVSKEPLFKDWNLLPMKLQGILIIQKKDTIPTSGYIYNNSYFINYPESQRNYRFK